ncbi:MAG: hypothetical protein V3W06_06255, partial [Acidimicrobiia bacterium]
GGGGGGFALLDLLAHIPDAAIIGYASPLQDLTVVTDYQAQPSIRARPEDVLHVFVNVMTNAIPPWTGGERSRLERPGWAIKPG